MPSSPRTIVIAGASLAGLSAADELRTAGFDGRIVAIGAEPHLPYDRPPLSKGYLSGAMGEADIVLPVPSQLDVTWKLGRALRSLDLGVRTVTLEDGEPVGFDGLVIATGASPRRMSFAAARGVHVLRTRDDADALKADLARKPRRVAVIGGGFIGAVIAATCRELDIAVSVIEPLAGLLIRALGAEAAAVFTRLHRERGVELRLRVQVMDAIVDHASRLRGLRLSDGTTLEAEVAVVAVGVQPQTGWLQGSGLDLSDGVLCDATCLAAPGVVAAGDLARWPNTLLDECRRVEHWDNAVRQGRHAARRLLSDDAQAQPYRPVQWVWSDQFGLKLQIYGSTADHEEVRFVDDPTDDHRFVAIYRRANRIVAVAGTGRTRALLAYRGLIEQGASWNEAVAAGSKS
jgi:NADPH-dependent 2,4-dienoyl-CoA reductase/sulfur reductase-like enzyme